MRTYGTLVPICGVLGSIAISGAAGSEGVPSCSDDVVFGFTACGGDLTGTWKLVGWCTGTEVPTGSGFDAGCSGATVSTIATPTETITFSSDGTYSSGQFTLASTRTETIPTRCLATSCDPGDLAINTGGTMGATCSISGSNCVCSGEQTSTAVAQTGTYTISGTTVTTNDGNAHLYCVRGALLEMAPSPGDSLSGRTSLVVVATRE